MRSEIRVLALLVSLSLICSCSQCVSSSGITVTSPELEVERLESNCLPLRPCSICKDSSGVTVRYEVLSQDCLCHTSPVLICHEPWNWDVSVNGTDVEPVDGMHLLDRDDACYLVADVVNDGVNVITLHGHGEVAPVHVSGDFSVHASDDAGWFISPARPIEIGPLAVQGMPFYTGEVSYSRQYELSGKVGRRILRIPHWEGRYCQVWVNGSMAAEAAAESYRKNIGPYLQQGLNIVELRIAAEPLPAACEPSRGEFGLFGDFTLE